MADTTRRFTYLNTAGLYNGDCVLCKLQTEAEETADLNNRTCSILSLLLRHGEILVILTLRKRQKCHVRTFSN